MFSVSALCHEMIHKVDADSGVLRFGGWLDGELEGVFGKGLAFDEHRTPVFKKYMAVSRDQGIYVMQEAYDRAGQTRRPSEYAKGFMEKLVGESMFENEIAKTRIFHLLYSSISDESDMTF